MFGFRKVQVQIHPKVQFGLAIVRRIAYFEKCFINTRKYFYIVDNIILEDTLHYTMSEVTKVLGEERPVQERAGSANVAEEPMVDSNEVLETYVLVKQRIIMVLTEANGIPPDEPTVQKLARLLVAGFFQRNQRGAPALG